MVGTMNVWMAYLLELVQGIMYASVPVALGFILKNGTEIKEWIQSLVESIWMKRILGEIWDTMEAAVGAVNQTYVDGLKAENAFDEAAVKEANKKAKEAFWGTLSDAAKKYIMDLGDNGGVMIDTLMERYVGVAKKDEVIIGEAVKVGDGK